MCAEVTIETRKSVRFSVAGATSGCELPDVCTRSQVFSGRDFNEESVTLAVFPLLETSESL